MKEKIVSMVSITRKLSQWIKLVKGWLLSHDIETSEPKPKIQIDWAHFLPKH